MTVDSWKANLKVFRFVQMSCNHSNVKMIHRRFNFNIIGSGEQNVVICEHLPSLNTLGDLGNNHEDID